MALGDLVISIVKIVAIIAYLYGLLWILNRPKLWVKIVGIIAAYAIVQLALTKFGSFQVFNAFDSGLLFQATSMTMVALGLNLIYGFNGQFSLGQWGFYGIGAYVAADITYRWTNGDSRGLLVVMIGTILGAGFVYLTSRWLRRYRGVPVLSTFTLYLIGSIAAGIIAVVASNQINNIIAPALGTISAPGPLNGAVPMQVVFFLAVVFAGIFAAEISFLFGLPVLTLGSDYFGIATLGFTIVVNTLLVNTDTILPFPEMRGGRGMLGIPQLTSRGFFGEPINWFWAFFFLMAVIIIMRNLLQSSTGRALVSVREDETAAKAMGIDVAGAKLMSFVVGSLFAGLAGGIYAHYIGFLSPATFDFLTGFNPLIIIVFGGLGSMTGTIAASFGWIFFLEGMLRVMLGTMGTEAPTWRYVFYPVTLLLLMLIRPKGLLGGVEWGFLKAPRIKPPKQGQQEPAAQTAATD